MLHELLAILLLVSVAGPRIVNRSIWGVVIAGAISYFGSKSKEKSAKKAADSDAERAIEALKIQGQQDKDQSRYETLLADWMDQKNKERNRDALAVNKQFSSLDSSFQRSPPPARVSDAPPSATLEGDERPTTTTPRTLGG